MGNLLCKCGICLNTIITRRINTITTTTNTIATAADADAATTSTAICCHHQRQYQQNHCQRHRQRQCHRQRQLLHCDCNCDSCYSFYCCWKWVYCNCCYCFCCHHYCPCGNVIHNNSVGVMPEKKLKLLLLGLAGSGKTEIAHQLAHIKRYDYEATNGVRHYNIQCDNIFCSLTEIGGNKDMQNIWHHYYASTMGLIYCFDMSATYNELKSTFDLLHDILKSKCMRGKPVLIVATKSDLVDESVQLYDIENEFQLEKLTAANGNNIKLCYSNGHTISKHSNDNLRLGIDWLLKYLWDNYEILQKRLNCDRNIQKWENQRNKLIAEGKLNLQKYQRFRSTHFKWRHSLKRPFTAPPITVFTLTSSTASIIS